MSLKHSFRIVLLILLFNYHCLLAQQNLFNVPSSDITLKSKPFFQQQINITKGFAQFNSTFSYGLGKNFEIGINVLGVDIDNETSSFIDTNGDTSKNPVYPFFTVNAQKAWILNNLFKLAVGTQTGVSKGGHFGSYDYTNLVTAIKRTKTKLITGLYYGTNTFIGNGNRNQLFEGNYVGFQNGIEQELFEGDFTLILENISGQHSLGETSFGITYSVLPHWVLLPGYQMPNLRGVSSNTFVIEFTYVPSVHFHKRIFRHGHHHVLETPKEL